MKDIEIPAFLRKIGDEWGAPTPPNASGIGYEKGLTPWGLIDYLKTHTQYDWPRSFEGLLQIGLSPRMVDWLDEAFMVDGGAGPTEQSVVASFLYLMSDDSTRLALAQSVGLVQTFKALADRLKAMVTRQSDLRLMGVDETTVAAMATKLTGMTVGGWFALFPEL